MSFLRSSTTRHGTARWERRRSGFSHSAREKDGPVNTVPQVAGDPHTLAREMITQVKHTQAGMLRVVNSPIKLSRTPVKLERASPVLGEHTEEVFMNLLGLSKADIAKLREEKAI